MNSRGGSHDETGVGVDSGAGSDDVSGVDVDFGACLDDGSEVGVDSGACSDDGSEVCVDFEACLDDRSEVGVVSGERSGVSVEEEECCELGDSAVIASETVVSLLSLVSFALSVSLRLMASRTFFMKLAFQE